MDQTIGDIRMHWRESGSGATGAAVLFVHGFPFHGGLWDEQLERLPERWWWIAPDLRGFGRSDAGMAGGPVTMDRLADDLVGLLDRLGIERATICGLSLGGYVAFALWRRHAHRVRSLVLCDTRPGADTEAGRRARVELALRIQREGASAAADAMLPGLISETTRRTRPEVEARLRSIIESNPPDGLVRALEAMADRPDSTELLPTITVPTLVVVGEADAVTPVAEAEAMAERVPDALLRVIPGAGHVSSIENPEAFGRELVQFLEATAG